MKKSPKSKPNGNVFKTIIRSVVREEIVGLRGEITELRGEIAGVKKDVIELRHHVDRSKEETIERMEELYVKYRDEVITKLDGAVGKLKKTEEEQTLHSGQHEDINNRLDALESIHPRGKHV